jgi:hypothetical protein
MKKLLILSFLFLACGKAYNYDYTSGNMITRQHALQLKKQLIAKQDKYGLFEKGENAFYRQGWFIVALHKHGILNHNDVTNFVISLRSATTDRCILRRPDLDYCISKDDSVMIGLALFYGRKYSGRAAHYMQHFFFGKNLYKKLDNMILTPHYVDFFNRVKGKPDTAFLRDASLRATAQITCKKPPHETSDKLLLSAMLMLARDYAPSFFSKEADKFCHKRVNYDRALQIYYPNHELQFLLKGLL